MQGNWEKAWMKSRARSSYSSSFQHGESANCRNYPQDEDLPADLQNAPAILSRVQKLGSAPDVGDLADSTTAEHTQPNTYLPHHQFDTDFGGDNDLYGRFSAQSQQGRTYARDVFGDLFTDDEGPKMDVTSRRTDSLGSRSNMTAESRVSFQLKSLIAHSEESISPAINFSSLSLQMTPDSTPTPTMGFRRISHPHLSPLAPCPAEQRRNNLQYNRQRQDGYQFSITTGARESIREVREESNLGSDFSPDPSQAFARFRTSSLSGALSPGSGCQTRDGIGSPQFHVNIPASAALDTNDHRDVPLTELPDCILPKLLTPVVPSTLSTNTETKKGVKAPDVHSTLSKPSRKKKQKMHTCTQCNREFPRPSGLKTHMNSHLGTKPFACMVSGCGRRFTVLSNAKRHLRTHGISIPPKSARDLFDVNVGHGDEIETSFYESVNFDTPQVCPVSGPSVLLPVALKWVPQFGDKEQAEEVEERTDGGEGATSDSSYQHGEEA